MRRLRWLVLLAGLCACGTLKTTPIDTVIPPAVQGTILDCAKGAAHDTAVSLIDDVGSALANDDWVGLLKNLVASFTADAVDCAVREVAGQSNHNAMASNDPLEAKKADRGRQWLAARGRAQ